MEKHLGFLLNGFHMLIDPESIRVAHCVHLQLQYLFFSRRDPLACPACKRASTSEYGETDAGTWCGDLGTKSPRRDLSAIDLHEIAYASTTDSSWSVSLVILPARRNGDAPRGTIAIIINCNGFCPWPVRKTAVENRLSFVYL
jgi:hypothetical protein